MPYIQEDAEEQRPWIRGQEYNNATARWIGQGCSWPTHITGISLGHHQSANNQGWSPSENSFTNYRLNRETPLLRDVRIQKMTASLRKVTSTPNQQLVPGTQMEGKRDTFQLINDHVDQSSADSITSQTDLVTHFERQLKKFMRLPKEEKFEEEEVVQEKQDKTTPEELPEKWKLLLQEMAGKSPLELLTEAKSSSDFSKALVKTIQSKSEEEISEFSKIVNSDIQGFVYNENTCYLVKCLIKMDDSTMKKAYNFVVNKLDELLTSVHTCRLIYTMCNHSERFRELLLLAFKTRMMKLLNTLSGAILLSLLICNYQDLTKFDFIMDELYKNPDIIKTPFFSRAFATYMSKCPMETLDQISTMLSKNLPFLLQDNYGNFLLQIFYDRDSTLGVEMCNQALTRMYKKVFVRRYSRYVLLKALQHKNGGDLAQDLLSLVIKDHFALENILFKKFSQELLMFALAKVPSRHSLLYFLDRLQKMNLSRIPMTGETSKLYKTLITDLSLLRKYAQHGID